ncbi:uncharacterized protein AC631_04393 [Debaryomyces fabryi]|uniref:Uncharacterized protein n=1 Tax=Debaryomyces fabryi TaxID=58627 RepID=A0A0V1PUA8_9ASCO|nr:uncharacterized protein AC631_04393 [Debaryomyces fabryi]KRZ99836.1 hypothetical protein AC631_04393 [Debaryomyces fabryi]CUM56604.1 unnamed protein product [Debaryomyces fabryi]
MTQLQRRHSGGKQFDSDIEKLITEDEPEKKRKYRLEDGILLLIPILMLLLVFLGLKGARSYKPEISSTDQFKLEQAELMHQLYHQKAHEEGTTDQPGMRWNRKGPTTTNDVRLLDVSSLSESNTVTEEILKLDDHIKQSNRPSATAMASDTVNVAFDLKEMMLISPVTILLDDDVSSSPEKNKFLEILFKSLSINPEPKVVNLSKHPHQTEIVDYLHKYSKHEYGSSNEEVSDDEDEDEQATPTREIPRLFVGGLPVGRFNDIIDEFKNNELIAHLRESGKGLINVN